MPARALEAGDVVWIPDLKQLPGVTRQAAARANNICNVLAFVLRHGQHVYGVIELASMQCDPPQEGMRQLFRLLGRDIGRFLEAMQYDAELEKKNARLAPAWALRFTPITATKRVPCCAGPTRRFTRPKKRAAMPTRFGHRRWRAKSRATAREV